MFLAKPHVTGPEGNVTSPDVIIDYLFVEGAKRPLSLLTHDCWQQAQVDATTAPAHAVMALGGGALISPALVLSDGLVILSRQAWRLANLDGHIGQVTLNGVPLAKIGLPAAQVEAIGGTGDALPRGYLVVKTMSGDTAEATLADTVLNRSLSHRVTFEPLDHDRWGKARPRPRYSVGPTQKDVQHFI